MSTFRGLSNIWRSVKEIELRPIQEAATRGMHIALVGVTGSGRHTLAGQMRSDPHRPDLRSQTPLFIQDLESSEGLARVDLIILLLDATHQDFSAEQALLQKLVNSGQKLLVFWNKLDLLGPNPSVPLVEPIMPAGVLYGSALDPAFLQKEFVPAVLKLLPDQQLALGRQFPLFRLAIARELVNDTCISNAAYSFSTGLAEVVPVLDIPLNITDMVVLTKAQAFLVYRLGLLLGFTTRWQDYIGEFGSVIGGGFLWRQLARSLVGLIPVWGIVPKVAVAYAGTYAVGHAVLQWYLTGRHINRKQLSALYRQAFNNGRQYAQRLVAGAARLRPRKKKRKALPPPTESVQLPEVVVEQPGPFLKNCAHCGRSNAQDAVFCQYCGEKLN